MASPYVLSQEELLPPLPDGMQELWPHQREPVATIARWFREGATLVTLDAPPGTGKSLIAESVRRELKVQALYLCQTKILQQQLVKSFPYARLIMGRDNYPTLDDFARTARDCDAWRRKCKAKRGCVPNDHCSFCHPQSFCPYDIAKTEAMAAPLAIANTAYAFLEWGARGKFRDWDLVVLDEWDEVEGVLFNTLNVELTPRELARFGVALPDGPADAAWMKAAAEAVYAAYDAMRDDPPDDWPRIAEKVIGLRRAAAGLVDKSWLILGQDPEKGIQAGPIEVGELGKKYLWPHGKRWLLMSGTAIDMRLRLKKLGWTDFGTKQKPGSGRYKRLGSVYPVANRPVRVWPVAPMTRANREQSIPKIGKAIGQILDHHKGERVLVHTGTYEITAGLQALLAPSYGNRLVTFSRSKERDYALERFLKQDGAVLMGPAMERGLDLADDACRVIVICRVPYPYRGDPRVQARAREGGPWWILQSIETIATIVQMTGRGMRHINDRAVSYILDSQFGKIRNHGNYEKRWPGWWKESLVEFNGFPEETKAGLL